MRRIFNKWTCHLGCPLTVCNSEDAVDATIANEPGCPHSPCCARHVRHWHQHFYFRWAGYRGQTKWPTQLWYRWETSALTACYPQPVCFWFVWKTWMQSCQPLCFGHSLLHSRALHYTATLMIISLCSPSPHTPNPHGVCDCATVCVCHGVCVWDCAMVCAYVRYCFNCCVWYFNCFNYITLSSKTLLLVVLCLLYCSLNFMYYYFTSQPWPKQNCPLWND